MAPISTKNATKNATKESTADRAATATWARRLRLAALVLLVAVAGSLIQGNLVLVGMSWFARATTDLGAGPELEGVRKLYDVDEKVWRGAQPGETGYRSLAARGVTTVVDLKPTSGTQRQDDDNIRALGMEVVHLPVTDGRPPSSSQVEEFAAIVRASNGRVFLHCGEGVGRAGTMAAAYRVTTGQTDASTAVRESLAVGVLTLEQVSFVRSLDHDGPHEPPAVATAVSRYLDGPRQLFNRFV
jgi:protein tyrosine phosphatase (PTP) superfamily phosphohydrolase (DUF442 family)